MKTAKALPAERCLELPPSELATRCPTIAGRFVEIDRQPLAFLDRLDQRRGSFLCDQDGGSAWRCRRVVVIDRELRGARKRNPLVFVTAAELVRRIASAASVKLGDEFGALLAPGLPPKTCTEMPGRGCAVQAARLRVTDRVGAAVVRRRLWLVEDADGVMLECSDAALTRCDELGAGGWVTLALTLRPSSLAAALPAPEIDLPEIRSDKRPGPAVVGGADTAETPVGGLDPYLHAKHEAALPSTPTKEDATRLARNLSAKGRGCLQSVDRATVDMVLSGGGQLISLLVDGLDAKATLASCLAEAARKLELPRFAANTYHLRTMVMRPAR